MEILLWYKELIHCMLEDHMEKNMLAFSDRRK